MSPWIDIADETVPLRFPEGERIDLGSSCGIRVWVRHGAHRCEVRIQFHHACTDGVGAYRFVEDLLCAYHNRTVSEEQRVSQRPLDAKLLERRSRFGISWLGMLMRLPLELWGRAIGFAMFFLLRPAKIHVPDRLQLVDPGAVPDLPAHDFSAYELAELKQAARREGATLNDLLPRDLCRAIHQWNERHGATSQWRAIRVTVPVDLRTQADEAMPAANVVAMVFVDRVPAWHVSSRRLLTSISWELGIIKRFRLALAFVRGTAIVGRIPGGLRVLTRANRCDATCVLSNIGRVLNKTLLPNNNGVLRAGDLKLESVEFATPVRPHTSVGVSCTIYAGRLRLVLNYDRHVLSSTAAEALLRTMLEQVGIESALAPLPVALAPAAA
jgi:hypothetical protein